MGFGTPPALGVVHSFLGPRTLLEPSGRVLIRDHFSKATLNWYNDADGNLILDATKRNPYGDAVCIMQTSGVSMERTVMKQRLVMHPDWKPIIGIEIAFNRVSLSGTLDIESYWKDGVNRYNPVFRIDFGAEKRLRYAAVDGTWVTLYTFPEHEHPQRDPEYASWVVAKLLWDSRAKEYMRVEFGGKVFDLSGIPVYTRPEPFTVIAPIQAMHFKLEATSTGYVEEIAIGYIKVTEGG